jgi:hypothetical protein
MVKKAKKRAKKLKLPETKWRVNQLKLFFYWMSERHKIYNAKAAGKPWPWTKDKILQTYKFTNVYRQLDKVTQEWTTRYMKLQSRGASKATILFHCLVFRLFNWPPTYDALNFEGLIDKWNMKRAVKILSARRDSGEDNERQIFTGAYIVPNGGSFDPKIDVICRALEWCHEHKVELLKKILTPVDEQNRPMLPSMEGAVNVLQNVYTIGPFIAYEIACDLRHTRILADACDVLSWANPGPGAKRGINRLMCGNAKMPGAKPDYIAKMRELYLLARRDSHTFLKCDWPFEMREIEHSLCEFDKMMRVKNGEGRPRSKYANPEIKAEDKERIQDQIWEAKRAKSRAKRKDENQLDLFA